MSEKIFREKSLEKVNSPEKLDECLKVTSASVWFLLIGIIALLVGVIVWGYFGKLNTYAKTGCLLDGKSAYCYSKQEEFSKIEVGQTIIIDNQEFVVESKTNNGVLIPEGYDYLKHLIDAQDDEFVFEVSCKSDLNPGIYEGKVVVEQISPLKFVFN